MAVTLAIATTARAAPPTRDDIGSIPYNFTVDCNPYGFDFANVVRGVETLFVETFHDKNGNPVQVVVHDGYTETDSNSVTGKTLPFSPPPVDVATMCAENSNGRRVGVEGDAGRRARRGVSVVDHDPPMRQRLCVALRWVRTARTRRWPSSLSGTLSFMRTWRTCASTVRSLR